MSWRAILSTQSSMCGREFAKQDDAVDVTKSSIPHKIGRGLDRMIEQLREAAVLVVTKYDRERHGIAELGRLFQVSANTIKCALGGL